MPENLDQPGLAAAEHVQVAAVRIALQALLDQECQAVHALAHAGDAGRHPDPHARRDGDHPRKAASTRRRAAKLTSLPTRTWRPSLSSISIMPVCGRGDVAEPVNDYETADM